MNEPGNGRDFCVALRAFQQKIFNCFHVMIGRRFDGLDAFRIGQRKPIHDAVQHTDRGAGKGRDFGNVSGICERF